MKCNYDQLSKDGLPKFQALVASLNLFPMWLIQVCFDVPLCFLPILATGDEDSVVFRAKIYLWLELDVRGSMRFIDSIPRVAISIGYRLK